MRSRIHMAARTRILALVGAALTIGPASAPASASGSTGDEPVDRRVAAAMSLERLDALVRKIAPGATREGPGWRLLIDEKVVRVIADARYDRIRVMVPVAPIAEVSEAMLRRCMEANFSAARDARYALAQDRLWSTFLHPLTSLDEALFLSALGQTVTLARTYGSSFRASELVYEGDHPAPQVPPEDAGPLPPAEPGRLPGLRP